MKETNTLWQLSSLTKNKSISLIFKSIKPEIVLLEGFCGNNDW